MAGTTFYTNICESLVKIIEKSENYKNLINNMKYMILYKDHNMLLYILHKKVLVGL